MSSVKEELFLKRIFKGNQKGVCRVKLLGFDRTADRYISILSVVRIRNQSDLSRLYMILIPKEETIVCKFILKDFEQNSFSVTYDSDVGKYVTNWIKQKIRPVISQKYNQEGEFLTDELEKSAYLQWWDSGLIMLDPWWNSI